jgi:hypothetical protein
MEPKLDDPLTEQIIGLAMKVHRALGPGFLEAVESLATAHEVQTVNYLTATGLDIGLLINFGSSRLQFKRKVRRKTAALTDGVD